LLTLAVDVVLKSNSTCPEHFLPVDPQYRLAWRQNQSTLLMSWFSKGFSGGMCLGLLVLRDLVDFDSLVYRNTQYVSHLLPWCSWDHHAAPLLLVRQSQGTCAEWWLPRYRWPWMQCLQQIHDVLVSQIFQGDFNPWPSSSLCQAHMVLPTARGSVA
jgi:hypothetical protein